LFFFKNELLVNFELTSTKYKEQNIILLWRNT